MALPDRHLRRKIALTLSGKQFVLLKKRGESMDERFKAVDRRFEDLQSSTDRRIADMQNGMNKRFEDMHRHTNRWMTIISLALVVLGALTTRFNVAG